MQLYNRIYSYIDEYWKLVYDYYALHGVPFPVTYYHIDVEESVWDRTNLMGGAYEKIGDLSGIKWIRILLFPVFQIAETSTEWDAQEQGYINEGDSEIVIPSKYGIVPLPNDMIRFHQQYVLVDRSDPNSDCIYTITGISKQTPQDRTYYKCKLTVEQSRKVYELDLQVSKTYVFFDYSKKIYSIENTATLTRMMTKNDTLKDRIKSLFDQNSGYLFV